MSRTATATQEQHSLLQGTAGVPPARAAAAAATPASSIVRSLTQYFQEYFSIRLSSVTAAREAYAGAVSAALRLEEYLSQQGRQLSEEHRRRIRSIINSTRELQTQIYEYACQLEASYSILLQLDWRQIVDRIKTGHDAVKARELEAEVKKLCDAVVDLRDELKEKYPENDAVWRTLGVVGLGIAVGGLAVFLTGGLALVAEAGIASSLLAGGAVIAGSGGVVGLMGLLRGSNDVSQAIANLQQIEQHLRQVRDGLIQLRVTASQDLPEIDVIVKSHTKKLLADIQALKALTTSKSATA